MIINILYNDYTNATKSAGFAHAAFITLLNNILHINNYSISIISTNFYALF